MRSNRVSLLALAMVSAACLGAADPTPPFKLPVNPPPATPEPSAVTTLEAGQVFVIQREADFRIYEGVKGLVSIKRKVLLKGQSHTIDGVFVDGKGEQEEREYVGTEKGLYLAIIRPKKDGATDVILAPRLATEDWETRLPLTVKMGKGPQPPTPKPPEPKPVDPAPIPVAGLRVLIVYESADLPKYTPQQNGILFGAKVREWLNANCVVGPDGKTREWRMWDKDVDTSGESKLWQEAMKRPRTSTPWVIISDGTKGFEGPLPANVDDFLALVGKYKGDK